MSTPSAPEAWDQVADIVRLVRTGRAQTRPELAEATRLGRNVITQRVQAAQRLGLIEPDGTGRSRGGRAADVWRFKADSGVILVGLIGIRRFRAYLTDLAGAVMASSEESWQVMPHPEETCAKLATTFDDLLTRASGAELWGLSIGLPAPVNFATGQSADPVTATTPMLRWHSDFDVRSWFAERFQRATWTDAVANLNTVGAAANPDAPDDLLVVRLGTGVGGGLVSAGRVHRGATWLAGELAHVTVAKDSDRICHCGRAGCLDAYASGWAVEADAEAAASSGRSPFLQERAQQRRLTSDDVSDGARFGDPASIEILVHAGEALGEVLAAASTWFNPAQIVIGGFGLAHNELFLNVVERTLQLNGLGTLVGTISIKEGDPDQRESLVGAVENVVDALTSPAFLEEWGPHGSPARTESLIRRETQTG